MQAPQIIDERRGPSWGRSTLGSDRSSYRSGKRISSAWRSRSWIPKTGSAGRPDGPSHRALAQPHSARVRTARSADITSPQGL